MQKILTNGYVLYPVYFYVPFLFAKYTRANDDFFMGFLLLTQARLSLRQMLILWNLDAWSLLSRHFESDNQSVNDWWVGTSPGDACTFTEP